MKKHSRRIRVKHGLKMPFHELEKAVNKWFNIVHEQKVAVSGPMVQENAFEYAR